MKTRFQLILVACLASVGVHLYLAQHYYPIKFGFASGESVCNINAKFNCDAVAASAYSSVFGVPLALWGVAANLVLFFMVLLAWLQWTEYPERLKRWALVLASLSVGASLVMGTISLLHMQNYCLFCIIAYGLSALIFALLLASLTEPFFMHIKRDLPTLWTENRGTLIGFALIPGIAFLGHQFFMQNFGDSELRQLVQESVEVWRQSPKNELVAKPALVKGPSAETAAVTLVEFADFRCSHCKAASYSLDAFVSSHPDVRFEFYNFPLDGACNEKIDSANGISCHLAALVHCADQEGKGWEAHHLVFEQQERVNQQANVAGVNTVLAPAFAPLGLNWERLLSCTGDPVVMDALRAQAKQGVLIGVRATPSLFANGKRLERGQLIPVLQSVRERSLEEKSN